MDSFIEEYIEYNYGTLLDWSDIYMHNNDGVRRSVDRSVGFRVGSDVGWKLENCNDG